MQLCTHVCTAHAHVPPCTLSSNCYALAHMPPSLLPPPQLYPYHLSEYICRIMRVTPFKYYINVLWDAMKEDKPYDSIPNFTVRCVGVGGGKY
jgi:hypothetical protein